MARSNGCLHRKRPKPDSRRLRARQSRRPSDDRRQYKLSTCAVGGHPLCNGCWLVERLPGRGRQDLPRLTLELCAGAWCDRHQAQPIPARFRQFRCLCDRDGGQDRSGESAVVRLRLPTYERHVALAWRPSGTTRQHSQRALAAAFRHGGGLRDRAWRARHQLLESQRADVLRSLRTAEGITQCRFVPAL